MRRGCDDLALDFRSISIPPHSVVQVSGFRSLPEAAVPCATHNTTASLSYAVITVDQPSFSYVVTLANQLPPTTPYVFSFVR